MPSWSFKLEGQVFNGMEIFSASDMDMEDKDLNLDPRVYGPVVCLYVHWFETFWEFVVQHFIGET